MTTPPDDQLLTQIKQYRLVRKIGAGAMGSVYEAIDTRDNSRVAVKMLHPWLAAQDSSFRDRFEREAHIGALLRSPYSVRLLDFGASDGNYFLVMEFVEGETVGNALARGGPMEPARALHIAIDVARALEEAGTRSIVHRDIKPENILLTADGRVKVADFGIARVQGGAGQTMAGGFTGTPEFAAPEQSLGEGDGRTDIYALGATLYAMLTGQPPFSGATAWDVVRQHQSAAVTMAPLANLPDSVTNPIRRCLEKDPRDRYQTATELAGALERALAAYVHSPGGHAEQRPGTMAGGSQTGAGALPGSPPADAVQGQTLVPQAPSQPEFPATVAGSVPTPVPQPAAQPMADVPLSMAATPGSASAPGTVRYELTISNPGQSAARISLSAIEPTGLLMVLLPPVEVLAPGATERVPIEVRQIRPAQGTPSFQFQVIAVREDGSRAAFVNLVATPTGFSAGGRSSGGPPRWLLAAGGGGLLAAALMAFLVFGGGGDSKPPTPPASSPNATSPAVKSPTGATGSGATSAPVATSPGTGKSIAPLDRWDLNFRITETSCAFGARVGDRYPVAFRFKPASGAAAAIKDGEQVTVTGIQAKEIALGTFTFHFTGFEFGYPVAAAGGQAGTATLTLSFADQQTIAEARLVERYDGANCTITGINGP